jgi:hypothetical protein
MPILLVALDGVDEIGPSPEHRIVRHVLQFFHEEDKRCRAAQSRPKAVLIVTCRDHDEVYEEWFSDAGFPSRADDSTYISVGPFSNAELGKIADLRLQKCVSSRIRHTLEALHGYQDPVAITDSPPRLAQSEIVEALKHPGLWRLFSEDIADVPEQDKILDGDPTALQRLCERYLAWLCWKAYHRRLAAPKETTAAIVCSVASQFDDPTRVGKLREDWVEPACKMTGCLRTLAEGVFKEARSLGLVARVEKTGWKWRHPFMCQHLANLLNTES